MKKVLVIGAGISGLSLAYRLQQLSDKRFSRTSTRIEDSGYSVTVLEQTDRPGGAAWTLREHGFQIEIGPNGFLDAKPSTLTLARAIGLSDKLLPASDVAANNRFLFLNGRLERLPSGFRDLVRSRLLSWRGKLSLVRERWKKRATVADESVANFAKRRAGHEIADVLADALVTGIYAGDPRLLSLPACFPRLAAFEREHGSVAKGFAAAARQRRLNA